MAKFVHVTWTLPIYGRFRMLHYFELEANLIYENHNDLFAEGMPDRRLAELTAVVTGREIKKIPSDNNVPFKRVKILKQDLCSKYFIL